MVEELLPAKLRPPRTPTRLVVRDRLLRRLDRVPEHRVTVVSAPAGYGKTTLAAAWRERTAGRGTPVGWLCLGHGERDPAVLARYLLAALVECGTISPDHPLATWTGSANAHAEFPVEVDAHTEFPVEVVAGLTTLARPAVVVLDDADAITGSPAATALASLLRNDVPLRLLVCSRTEAPLPVGRLLAADELGVIARSELACTGEEVVHLGAAYGLALTTAQGLDLARGCDGWMAALVLALRTRLADTATAVADQLTGGTGPIAEYLRDDVYAEQSPEVQGWLLRTAILTDLRPDLADAVTSGDDGASMIDRMCRENLFVHVDPLAAGTVRYNPVFRQFLLRRAGVELTAQLPELHRRAGRCLAASGDPVGATRHAAAAGDWSRAATLLTRDALPQLYGRHRDELSAVLSALHHVEASADARPVAQAHALAAAEAGDPTAGRLLHIARGGGDLDASLGNLVDVLIARHSGDLDRVVASASAWARTEPGPLRAVADWQLGYALLWSGAFGPAERALLDAIGTARDGGLVMVEVSALSDRALLLALWGRFDAARDAGRDAIRLARTESRHAPRSAVLALGIVHAVRATYGAARHCLEAARGLGTVPFDDPTGADLFAAVLLVDGRTGGPGVKHSAPLLRAWTSAVQADALLRSGHPEAAFAEVEELVSAVAPDLLVAPALVVAAAARRTMGEPELARRLLAPMLENGVDTESRIRAWLVDALAAEDLGLAGAARVGVSQALTIGRQQGCTRVFTDPALLGSGLLARHHDLVDVVPTIADAVARAGQVTDGAVRLPAALIDAVTQREHVVLRYLPTLLTTDDIAGELRVSRNTVKSQIKSVYRKLGVVNRRDAVHRARQLNLL